MKLTGFWTGLDWDSWSYNLIKGILSGGATSAQSALTALIVDPQHFALGSANSWKMIWVSWLLGAAGFTFAFMSKNGLPEQKKREETVEVAKTTKAGTVTTTTTKDTSMVSKDEPLPGQKPLDKP